MDAHGGRYPELKGPDARFGRVRSTISLSSANRSIWILPSSLVIGDLPRLSIAAQRSRSCPYRRRCMIMSQIMQSIERSAERLRILFVTCAEPSHSLRPLSEPVDFRIVAFCQGDNG
jgi:hypothetical protein